MKDERAVSVELGNECERRSSNSPAADEEEAQAASAEALEADEAEA